MNTRHNDCLIVEMAEIDDEIQQEVIRGVRGLMALCGEDWSRNGLTDTPARFIKAMIEQTKGYKDDPQKILSRTFDEKFDEMITVSDIDFNSLCEHHLLPFTGTATIGYVPNGNVVGLSKLPRLVDCYANRLQIQERLTKQIADAIDRHLEPRGVGVTIKARHQCVSCRGIKKANAEMVTTVLHGIMKEDGRARAEYLQFVR